MAATAVALLAGSGLAGAAGYAFSVKTERDTTVEEVLRTVGPHARSRLQQDFTSAGVRYAPAALTLLAVKDAAVLEVWADHAPRPRFVRRYQIEALSGVAGPKLREGDRQVPEGIYRVEGLNPNSRYHLSMKLDYPNAFDLKHARSDGRTQPGSNIFIHGKASSIGCLAMGDQAIEELFVLVHDVGIDKVRVVIAPTDPRAASLDASGYPPWVSDLYRQIERQFRRYPVAEI